MLLLLKNNPTKKIFNVFPNFKFTLPPLKASKTLLIMIKLINTSLLWTGVSWRHPLSLFFDLDAAS